MESLDHTSSTYHPCNISTAKSTNCIDQLAHLHSKRDSAYSSFSTNSSIPEYHPTTFCRERCNSMESMFSRGNLQEGIKHADIRYIKTVYDSQRGVSEEYEVNSSVVKNRGRLYSGYVRNSSGPLGRFEQNRILSENDIVDKSPPMPPARSDSYAVTKHHERPSSLSSLDQNRQLRAHFKGPGTSSTTSTSNSNQHLKSMFSDGQLHTVQEKSPECSPSMKPKQFYSEVPQPGQPMFPAGIYPVPPPEPHFAHAPQTPKNSGSLYPALAKEGAHNSVPAGPKRVSYSETKKGGHGHCNETVKYPNNQSRKDEDTGESGPTQYMHYKPHFSHSTENSYINNEDERTLTNKNQCFDRKDQLPTSESQIMKTYVKQASNRHTNGDIQLLINKERSRSHPGSTIQNQGSYKKTKPDAQSTALETSLDKPRGLLNSADTNHSAKQENILSVKAPNHINQAENPSCTKPTENLEHSMMYVKDNCGETSALHKNHSDRRRESFGSYQSNNNLTSVKPDNRNRSSVLEKISQIEQREQENHTFQALPGNVYGQPSGQCTKGANRASVNSIDDLRNKYTSQEPVQSVEYKRLSGSHMIEKTYGGHQLQRFGSVYRSGDNQKAPIENHVDCSQDKINEQSVWQPLPSSNTTTASSKTMPNKEDDWKNTAQDTLGFSRAYRNSIKDAQSKVLEATSYRRKDLDISPPQFKKPNLKRPTSAIVYGKTSPVSPHAPKERHSVTPTENLSQDLRREGTSSPCQVTRIGARRRLTAEQKKRSYSEPEKMNEVGASDNESLSSSSQKMGQTNFLDQTVADRRRMFEREGKACSTVNLSKPELKQLQQIALADYIERKTGRRPSSQEPGLLKERSQSSYFSGSMMDTKSISSTSSINSLQDHNMSFHSRDPRESVSKTGRVSSTLPPGLTGLFDLANLEKNNEHQETRGRTSSFIQQRLSLDFKSSMEGKNGPLRQQREVSASKPTEFVSVPSDHKSDKTIHPPFQDHLKNPTVLHLRSKSSPAMEMLSQDFPGKRESPVNNGFYTSTSKGNRSPRSKSGTAAKETAPYVPESQPYTITYSETEGERMVLSSDSMDQTAPKIYKHIRAQSAPLTSGYFYNPHNINPSTLNAPGNTNPAKMTQDSSNQAPFTAEGCMHPGNRNPAYSSTQDKDKGHVDLGLHDNISAERSLDKAKKASAPQRPPPPKIQCPSLSKEANVCHNNIPSGQKVPSSWKSSSKWSTSSSEPETPCQHRGISLRISESGLLSSPVAPNDDVDDDVFVKDQDLETLHEIPFGLPSPPPFPPPTLEDALVKESQEKLSVTPPTVYNDKVKEDLQEKFPNSVENPEQIEATEEKSGLNIPAGMVPTRDCELSKPEVTTASQRPRSKESLVGESLSSQRPIQCQGEKNSVIALEPSENTFSNYLCTFSHIHTSTLSPEDVKSQELAKEISEKDKSLADILDPELKMQTTMNLLGGIFMSSTGALREDSRRWIKTRVPSEEMSSALSGKKDEKRHATESVGSSSGHYALSASRAELLQKITESHTRPREEHHGDVNEKKAELISILNHKLSTLKSAKESLAADMKLNNSLGEQVEAEVEKLCKPNEYDKYKMFIGDLDKIVNLLLSLSGRLARAENALRTLSDDTSAEERNNWNEKKKQLCGQHDDARELKENLDRRERIVTDILGNYFSKEQFEDYQHFVKMKSALLVEQRELDDKIRLSQEQLSCLLESLPRDFMHNRKVSSREVSVSSVNVKMLPPMTTSL